MAHRARAEHTCSGAGFQILARWASCSRWRCRPGPAFVFGLVQSSLRAAVQGAETGQTLASATMKFNVSHDGAGQALGLATEVQQRLPDLGSCAGTHSRGAAGRVLPPGWVRWLLGAGFPPQLCRIQGENRAPPPRALPETMGLSWSPGAHAPFVRPAQPNPCPPPPGSGCSPRATEIGLGSALLGTRWSVDPFSESGFKIQKTHGIIKETNRVEIRSSKSI